MKKLMLVSAILMLVLVIKTEAFSRHNGVDFNFFYSSLSPYGEWVEIDYDVYAWRPVGVRSHWRPYSDGRWVWTNNGWYWDSYEPFGWATFHYGRWYYDDYYGWMWLPDNEWGPAWVDWRYDDDYIGWSPLPPYAHFGIDFGIHFSVDWYAPVHYWNFVRYNHFCGHDVHNYIIADKYKNNIFKHTKYRNDYGYRDGRIINRGVDRDFIERRSGSRITERELVSTTRLRDNNGNRSRDNRVEVYRPSDDDVKRTRNIDKFEIRKSEKTTNLDLRKVEKNRIVRPDNKTSERVIINKGNRNAEILKRNDEKKVNTERNIIRNEERTINKNNEVRIEKKNNSENRTLNRTGNNETKSDSRNFNVNKSQTENRKIEKRSNEINRNENRIVEKRNNEINRNENRTIEKRSTEIKRNETRNVERSNNNSKSNNSNRDEKSRSRSR